MPRLTIDGREIEVERGTTLLDAARKLGISIPTLCLGEGLPPVSSCMVCAVKDRRNGRYLPSCEAKALDSMEIDASGDGVIALRREALTLLVGEHAGDCEAPCQRACPAGTAIPGLMRLLRRGRYAEALVLARRSLPFPGVLGRICEAPCERVCRRSLAEGPLSVRRLHGFLAQWESDTSKSALPPREGTTGKTVAIAGAGPAGLSAAWFLLLAGHDVRLYEKQESPGGWLRTGPSSEEMPPSVLEADLQAFERLGARLHTGQELGETVTLDDLASDFDAVLLAPGGMALGEIESLGLRVSAGGIAVNRKTFMTDRDGVFAVGDVVKAGSRLVRTVALAREAALSLGRYLFGAEEDIAPPPFQSRLGRLSGAEAVAFLNGRPAVAGVGVEPRDPPEGDTVSAEAGRCLECDCLRAGDCRLRALAGELDVRGGGNLQGERKPYTRVLRFGSVILDRGKCILCGLCVRSAEAGGEKVGLAFQERGARTEVSPPLAEERDRVLESTAGSCVEICPTGALAYDENGEGNHG